MSLTVFLLVACFWLCLAGVCYAYIGYPLLIYCLARWFGRRRHADFLSDEELPLLSLLIAAHNEEAVIDERVRNALALNYPANKLEIVVACDGCIDATAAIVERYAPRGVRLLNYPQRRGKATALNNAFAVLKGDIVMLSDANTHTDASAARKLVRWFRDPAVGVVCGRLVLTDPATGQNVDSLYWKYETFLKRCEGRLGALLGSNGAIYAIRREQFQPLPANTILDDMVVPLRARLRTGCAIVYDTQAVAYEETAADVRAEFRRRSRIGAGGFQCLGLLGKLLDPRQGWIAFTFLSHKVLRWLCPFLLLGLLLSNLLLSWDSFYAAALLAQSAFYALALSLSWVPSQSGALKPLRLTTMFASMNAALLMGFWLWASGGQKVTWRRTARLSEVIRGIQPVPAPVERAVEPYVHSSVG
jgi:cellulose synthase/poly-beta-1,6-N-acetylglucosamine synthase-like glycosyltransferase